jgi:putative SOS response-associated peptidase YedK
LLINARSETARDKPAFRNALKRRRCIVPADGYYEWQPGSTPKQPYFIYRRDEAPFAFAALYETWNGPNGEQFDSVAIITAASQGEMAALHDRVPVTIETTDIERWMDCLNVEAEEAMTMLTAPPPGVFVWRPVSTRVNKVANDDAQLLLSVTLETTPPAPPPRAPRKAPAARQDDKAQGQLF